MNEHVEPMVKTAIVEQEASLSQKMSGLIEEILEIYKEDSGKGEEDEIYQKMQAKADAAKDLLINMDDEPTEDEGLIGPFKLRPCDEIIDRPSRRRRKMQPEEMVEPFMRSMPY